MSDEWWFAMMVARGSAPSLEAPSTRRLIWMRTPSKLVRGASLVEIGDEEYAELVQKIFGAWLNATRLHGCVFAGWAVGQRRIRFASFFDPPDDTVISQLTHHIELAESQSQLALAVFPSVVTEEQLFDLIELF
jgi:hypothetical protein